MREINYKNSKELQNIVQSFSDKYSGTLNQMYGKENTYDIDFVDNFCDAFISAKTELLKMEKLSSTNINQTELLNTCFEFNKIDIDLDDTKVFESAINVFKDTLEKFKKLCDGK